MVTLVFLGTFIVNNALAQEDRSSSCRDSVEDRDCVFACSLPCMELLLKAPPVVADSPM